jgi:hypothetical protein
MTVSEAITALSLEQQDTLHHAIATAAHEYASELALRGSRRALPVLILAGQLRECALDIDLRMQAELENEPALPGDVTWEMDVLLIAATVTDDDVDEHEHDPLYRVRAAIDQIVSKRLRDKRIRALSR